MPEHLDLALRLREVVAAAAEIRREIARGMGLSPLEMDALDHLVHTARGPGELARLLAVSPAAATGVVDRLAARGFVERRHHADDRRRVEVRMTDAGRADVVAELEPMFLALRQAHAAYDADERALLDRYLRTTTAALHASGLTRGDRGATD